ncbi:MAG: DUF3592 domain-containing protein [Nitrospinaceae bacterium]
MDKPLSRKDAFYLCGSICVALSLFCIIPSQFEINSAKEAMHWLPKQAEITDSRVVSSTTYSDNRKSTSYRAEIKGIWVENQRPFEIERIFFAQIQDRAIVEQTVKEYPPGKVVTVFVAPDNPYRVILKKDVSLTSMYWMQAVGAIFIIFGLIIFSEAKKKTPPPVL